MVCFIWILEIDIFVIIFKVIWLIKKYKSFKYGFLFLVIICKCVYVYVCVFVIECYLSFFFCGVEIDFRYVYYYDWGLYGSD